MNNKTKDFLKAPTQLTKVELTTLVRSILFAMYVEDDNLDPDKEWSIDTLDEICNILDSYKLVPK